MASVGNTPETRLGRKRRSALWAKLRGLVRARELEGGQLASQYWPQFGLAAVTPQIVVLHKKQATQIYELVRKEHEAHAPPSASQVGRGLAVLRRAASGLERSRRRFEVFSFGLTATCCDVEAVFAGGLVHVSSADPGRTGIVGPCFCIDDARRVITWTRADPQRVAFVVADSETHLNYLAVACVLCSAVSLRGRRADIEEAVALYDHMRVRGLYGMQNAGGASTGSPSSSSSSYSAPPATTSSQRTSTGTSRKRPNLWSRVSTHSRWSRGSAASYNPQTPGDGSTDEDPSTCARRVVSTIGFVRGALPPDAGTTCWRKMVLRKVILSHAPRISSETRGHLGCRPYVMIMNGDQSDFLHSTMVQGIREARYAPNVDVSFDINRRVDRDVVLKVYHLEPGQPGRAILQTHVNVASAEPCEDASVYEEFPEGEQLVIVNIPKASLDVQSLGNTLDRDFQISCIFGMQPSDRAVALHGPQAFVTERGLSGYGGAGNSATVESLDLETPMPPMQFKCPTETCGRLQYIHHAQAAASTATPTGPAQAPAQGGASSSASYLSRARADDPSLAKMLTCEDCCAHFTPPSSALGLLREMARASLHAQTESDVDTDIASQSETCASDEIESLLAARPQISREADSVPPALPARQQLQERSGGREEVLEGQDPIDEQTSRGGASDVAGEPDAPATATAAPGSVAVPSVPPPASSGSERLIGTVGSAALETNEESEVQRFSQPFDMEAAFEARRQAVCEVLGAVRPSDRRDIERRLRLTLEFCHSEADADQAVHNFVNQSLESPTEESLWGSRRGSRRNVRFNLGARGDNESQVRFTVPSGGGRLRGDEEDDSGGFGGAGAAGSRASDAMTSNAARVVLLRGAAQGDTFMDHLLASMLTSVHHQDAGSGRRRRSTGMSDRDILRLPEHEFKSGNSSSDQVNCLICLGEYTDGDRLRTLPCFHRFHSDCIFRWLMDNAKCPICQRDSHDISHGGGHGGLQ